MSQDSEKPDGNGHEKRVHEAFESFRTDLGDRAGDVDAPLEKLKEAAARNDVDEARGRLAEVKEQHGWLYEEMAKHPKLAALIDELALWGF